MVMLTAESEGGTLKCHPYWTGREFGPIKLKPLSEKKVSLDIDKHRTSSTATASSASGSASEYGRRRANTTTTLDSTSTTPQPLQTPAETPYVIIRKFALSHTTHPFAPIREVTQLHYPSWPDFGAPAQPSHLLALVELANLMQRAALPVDANTIAASGVSDAAAQANWYDMPEQAQARPMLVHCSAGCGRTGTFCTVDTVLDMLKRQRLSSLAASKQRDADGDVDMDEAISPHSAPKDPFARRQNNSHSSIAAQVTPTLNRNTNDSNVDVAWLDNDTLDLIEKTVEDFRGQRISMVQSLRQFVLCYETIVEWVWRHQERASGAASVRARARSGSLENPSRR